VVKVPVTTGSPGVREVAILRQGQTASERDSVAVEEPMEVRVNGASFAVIMRTPGADRDLTAGFLLAEDVIRSADEVGTIEYCQDVTDDGRDNTINVTVTGEAVERLSERLGQRRQVMMRLLRVRPLYDRIAAGARRRRGDWSVSADVVAALPDGCVAVAGAQQPAAFAGRAVR
jgi:FdhD protein